MIQVYKETVRGNTVDWSFIITLNGVPFDITGCTFRSCAKKSLNDPDAAAVVPEADIDVTIQNAVGGIIDVAISDTVVDQVPPGHYYIDIKMDLLTGDVITPIRVMWEVLADVLRS